MQGVNFLCFPPDSVKSRSVASPWQRQWRFMDYVENIANMMPESSGGLLSGFDDGFDCWLIGGFVVWLWLVIAKEIKFDSIHLLRSELRRQMSVNLIDHFGRGMSRPFTDGEQINPGHRRNESDSINNSSVRPCRRQRQPTRSFAPWRLDQFFGGGL